ncbi:MAG: MBL fold metallo-hydrolase [Pseudarcicella sp.]|nr:MBL fold metallo-hydrolase [Pseudarcicella sp.]MBP6410686.1 MBL fold metallo-hydrolase [Pseudarcicella sp.]
MKLTFWGASKQVTGSMYLLEIDDYSILIDCGTDMEREIDYNTPLEQGYQPFFPFEASMVNLVILTHAHIDHSGNIPMLYREGYEGQILCTAATADLTEILLYDSANIHAKKLKNAEGNSNKKAKKMDRLLKKGDMYLHKDVEESTKNFITIPFNNKFKIQDKIQVTFLQAGHLLGAAHVVLEIEENGIKKSICFSGDLGRNDYPLLKDPQNVPQVDYLLCETTYGSRKHQDMQVPEEALESIIQETCIDKPGRLIIPAFSVGRTQALLFTLNKLYSKKNIKPIKVFSDSPLAYSSSKIYQKYLSLLNQEAKDFYKENEALFDFENFQYIQSEKSSKAISNYREPCIIVSASGMVSGGRVEQHVAANINNSYCTILLVGYASEGTLGHRLMNGQKTILIKDKEHQVLAKVSKTDVFSGHGDQDDLIKFVKYQDASQIKKIFLIHGEPESMDIFHDRLKEEGYHNVEIPEKGQCFEL